MEFNWIMFLPGLLLLFYPSAEQQGGRVRLFNYEDIRNNRGGVVGNLRRQSGLWVDPLRSFAGAWLLRNAWTVDAIISGPWKYAPLAAAFIVLALAVGVRMHTRSEDGVFFAPIGYVAGLVFATLPVQVAVLVVAFAGACLMAFRAWSAFFLCGAFAAAVFGYLILRGDLWMAGTVALLFEPLFLGMLLKRNLVFPVAGGQRRRSSKRRASSRPVAPVLEASR